MRATTSITSIHPIGRLCRAAATTTFVCGFMLALTVASAQAAGAGEFKVIHKFTGGSDGKYPEAGLTAGDGGTLYSTTFGSVGQPAPTKNCSKNCGNEYAIRQNKLTTGYIFKGGSDGAFPTAEVVVVSSGAPAEPRAPTTAVRGMSVYGTTEFGGGTACNGLGCGTLFEITGPGTDQVYQFCRPRYFPACANGAFPHAGPIIGSDGNLYGTTSLGGSGSGYECDNNFGGCGTVYMMTPDLKTETPLYSFCQMPACQDGAIPYGKVWRDASGDLYGTTQFGGRYGEGIIFELVASNGTYTESVLYSFCAQGPPQCTDGAIPEAGLVADSEGNLYGTASAGGGGNCSGSAQGCGVVFELAVGASYNVLHAFTGGSDGALPQAPLVTDGTGNLYGTTEKGGGGPYCANPSLGCGTVFKLAANGAETILHTFGEIAHLPDGAQPEGALLLRGDFLYGATRVEGNITCDCGTLFKIDIGSEELTKSLQKRPLTP